MNLQLLTQDVKNVHYAMFIHALRPKIKNQMLQIHENLDVPTFNTSKITLNLVISAFRLQKWEFLNH